MLYTHRMPHIDSHPPGSFSWVELGTSDQSAAKNFYGSLFGWEANDMPIGPDEHYTIFRLEARDAAAAYTLRPGMYGGAPPHWMPYISVTSTDDFAARAGQMGGKVLAPPMDVFDAGRMAVVQVPYRRNPRALAGQEQFRNRHRRSGWHAMLGRLDDHRCAARQGILRGDVRLEYRTR